MYAIAVQFSHALSLVGPKINTHSLSLEFCHQFAELHSPQQMAICYQHGLYVDGICLSLLMSNSYKHSYHDRLICNG